MARIEFTKALVAHIATVLIAAVALVGLGLSGTVYVKSYAECIHDIHDKDTKCGKDYMPALWVLLLEILVLAATLVGTGTGLAQKFHYGLVGFLVLGCAGLIDWAERTLLGDQDRSHISERSLEKVAASGFTILALVNVGLILWLGVQRVKGNTSGLRPVRECSPQRFSIFLFVTFGVCVGSFMVAAASHAPCAPDVKCASSETPGLKWWGIASVLVTTIAVGVGEVFGILENFGPTLSALVALAAATTMDITDEVVLHLDGSVPGNILAGGFIILSIMCLGVILLLGLMSPGTPEGEEVLGCSTHLVAYTALPLVFGSAITVFGVVEHNYNCSADKCLGKHANYLYWTIALELFTVVLTLVGKKSGVVKLKVPSLLFIVLATICHMAKVGHLLKFTDFNLGLAAAGFVITIAMNFILIGLLGYEGSSDFGGFLRLEA